MLLGVGGSGKIQGRFFYNVVRPMNKNIVRISIVFIFAWLSFDSYQASKAMHERGVVISGSIVRHKTGDMSSSCPVAAFLIDGRRAEAGIGSCSSNPQAIGSKVEMLYDPVTKKVVPNNPGSPYYTESVMFIGIGLIIFLFLAGPNNSLRLPPSTPE